MPRRKPIYPDLLRLSLDKRRWVDVVVDNPEFPSEAKSWARKFVKDEYAASGIAKMFQAAKTLEVQDIRGIFFLADILQKTIEICYEATISEKGTPPILTDKERIMSQVKYASEIKRYYTRLKTVHPSIRGKIFSTLKNQHKGDVKTLAIAVELFPEIIQIFSDLLKEHLTKGFDPYPDPFVVPSKTKGGKRANLNSYRLIDGLASTFYKYFRNEHYAIISDFHNAVFSNPDTPSTPNSIEKTHHRMFKSNIVRMKLP